MDATAILAIAIKISIFLVVLRFGLEASIADVLFVFRQPGLLIRSIVSIYVIVPAFAIFLVKVFSLNPVLEVALVGLSISPVPPILPNKALKKGGEKKYTFGLLAAISVLSLIIIPIEARIFNAIFNRETVFSETSVLITILVSVIVPFAIGMIIRHFAPAVSQHARLIGKIGMVILIVAFLPILIALLPAIWSLIGNGTILAIIAFTLVALTAGHLLGGPDPTDRLVLALATAARHPAIAIGLVTANVDGSEKKLAIAAILLYLLVSGIIIGPYLNWLGGHETKGGEVPNEA